MEGYEFDLYDGDDFYAGASSGESEEAALNELMRYVPECDDPLIYRVTRTLVQAPNR